jgi:hypothetical protein
MPNEQSKLTFKIEQSYFNFVFYEIVFVLNSRFDLKRTEFGCNS